MDSEGVFVKTLGSLEVKGDALERLQNLLHEIAVFFFGRAQQNAAPK